MIGDITPAEWSRGTDPQTGRAVTRFTSGASNDYPLYYFTPSVTPDLRWLVFHSERSGEVQLYRLDLATGEIGQLTDGHTRDAGWGVWCEWHLDGIYNHLSALHPMAGEVWYFEDGEIRATHLASFANRRVTDVPSGRMPIGQSAFSPDGRCFAYIHADERRYRALLADREARTKAGLFTWASDHQIFRNAIGATLALVDTDSGAQREVITTDYHFHHVLFVDNDTLLVNHPRGVAGMWVVRRDGSGVRHLRPQTDPRAHGAMVNHQVVTARGIAYEAVAYHEDGTRDTYLGMYDPRTDSFAEALLPTDGYVHVGFDPMGRFDFVENSGRDHTILAVRYGLGSGAPLGTSLIRRLSSPDHDDQRFHAHPFLANDRQQLYFTDFSPEGRAQICAVDVSDLVAGGV
ncbi:MAG TPA: hypothetical protein VHA07_14160 [Devosia sp.]|nr:hypothetical protein [Devosia sp.]